MTKKELENKLKELEKDRDNWRDIAQGLLKLQPCVGQILPQPVHVPQIIPYQPTYPGWPLNPVITLETGTNG